MPTLKEIVGNLATLTRFQISNVQRLFQGFVRDGAQWEPKAEDFNWWPAGFADFTTIEIGSRMPLAVAQELDLVVNDVRPWPDGREYLAVPLPFLPPKDEKKDVGGQIAVPPVLGKRRNWFPLIKVVTRTACDRKSRMPFYTCCLSNDGEHLYKTDSERPDGTRSHSIAYYLTYGQMAHCKQGTEGNPVKIRPMFLIHMMRDKDDVGRIRVVVQKLMLLRGISRSGNLRYRLTLTRVCGFTVSEKDPGDGHGLRLLPSDILYGLTGEHEWLAPAVRESYGVLSGKVEIPLFADQYDPLVSNLFAAIFSNNGE